MELNQYSEKIYQENLDRYALYDPQLAIHIDNLSSNNYQFCYTHLGELNLKFENSEKIFYFHDNDGAISEAKEWFKGVPLNYNHLFLYGIGLGYYYLVAKTWLKKSPNNYLFILEDDLEVLKNFLKTSLATELLNDSQVIIQFLQYDKNIKKGLFKSLFFIIKGFLRQHFYLSSSKLYSKIKDQIILYIKDALFQLTSWNVVRAGEIVNAVDLIFGNFFHNTLRQYKTYDGNLLKNAFFGMPAIICGAGPSLVKDIANIKKLQDKAIIIASGTGMNVLNYYGITPHFGTAIDPTDSQTTRIKTNAAFEVPFFYKTRFNKDSFDFLHGPKVLISGKSGYSISEWFTPLVSTSYAELDFFKTGISSSNFAMELARHLGCNPILLLGIDLAYTDASRYPPMISAHPLDTKIAKNEIDKKSEVLLGGIGNHRLEVISKIDWITEARLISQFQRNNRDRMVLNCAYEGLAINEIPYKSLSEFILESQLPMYDTEGWIHCSYIQLDLEKSKERCMDAYKEWHESIKRSIHIYSELIQEILLLRANEFYKELLPPYTPKIALLEAELSDEPAFKYFVSDLIEIIDDIAIRQKLFYRCHSSQLSEKEKNLKRLEIDLNYIYFLKGHLEKADLLIDKMFKNFMNEEDLQKSHLNKDEFSHPLDFIYKIENEYLIIFDKELSIDIKSPFSPKMIPSNLKIEKEENAILMEEFLSKNKIFEGQYLRFYENGKIKSECYYANGLLHGPSKWLSEEGTLLSEKWFVDGSAQGKAYYYYLNGNIHSIRSFRDGKKEGVDIYFFKNGLVKSKINHQKDQFHGLVELYYENGVKKRELNFFEGKLEGKEKYWDRNGTLLWEAEYKNGLPDGKSTLWNANGKIMREYTYFSDHKKYNLKEWNESGKLILEENNMTENLKETAEKKRHNIANALDQLNRELFMIQTLTKEEKKRLFY